MGLFNALRHLAAAWNMAHRGFSCELTTPDVEPELSDDASLTIYRIVQECLTNIARHSKADRVEIAVGIRPGGSLIIRIADNGVGLPKNFRFGFGFLGMSERVRKLNGKLDVSNRRGGGTLVEVTMPLPSHEIAQAS